MFIHVVFIAQSAAATSTVAGAMHSAAGAMAAVGAMADPHKMQQQMGAFTRESERLDMASDMMDDGLFEEDDESEADEIVDQVRSSIPSTMLLSSRLVYCTESNADTMDADISDGAHEI